MESFHFENDQVIGAIAGTDYLKQSVLRRLIGMTSGEKWALYRAIVKLADEMRGKDGNSETLPGR